MKRVAAAIIIFVMTVLTVWLPSLYTQSVCERMLAETEKLRLTADSGQAELVRKEWEKYGKRMRCYIGHGVLDEVSETTGLLTVAAETGDKVQVITLCASLDGQLRRIVESEKASAENIF